MRYVLSIIAVLLTSAVNAQDLQHFDTEIFGRKANERVALLLPADNNAIRPINVLVDIDENDGKFYAATLYYPEKITLGEARASVNKLYKKYERKSFANDPKMGLWRNEDRGFSIQLSVDKDEHKKVIQVVYISFFHRNTAVPTHAPDGS